MSDHHYICFGPVRGECGVKHRTPGAAHRHLLRDIAACLSIPGGHHYSDRNVWMVTATNTPEPRYHHAHPDRPGFAEVGSTWREIMGW